MGSLAEKQHTCWIYEICFNGAHGSLRRVTSTKSRGVEELFAIHLLAVLLLLVLVWIICAPKRDGLTWCSFARARAGSPGSSCC